MFDPKSIHPDEVLFMYKKLQKYREMILCSICK
jgi:hypothetical protein